MPTHISALTTDSSSKTHHSTEMVCQCRVIAAIKELPNMTFDPKLYIVKTNNLVHFYCGVITMVEKGIEL